MQRTFHSLVLALSVLGCAADLPVDVPASDAAADAGAVDAEPPRFELSGVPLLGPEFALDEPSVSYEAAAFNVPSVAFDGTVYLAVWRDDRPPSSRIRFARIAADGTALDSTGTYLGEAAADAEPRVAASRDGFMVVWRTSWGSGATACARIGSDGAITRRRTGIGAPARFPDVASNGDGYLVTVGDSDDHILLPFDADGVQLPYGGRATARVVPAADSPRLAFDGEGYVVAWLDGDLQAATVRGSVVSSPWTVYSPEPEEVLTAFDVAASAGVALFAWQSAAHGVRARRFVVSDEMSLDPTPLTVLADEIDDRRCEDPAAPGLHVAEGNEGFLITRHGGCLGTQVVWIDGAGTIVHQETFYTLGEAGAAASGSGQVLVGGTSFHGLLTTSLVSLAGAERIDGSVGVPGRRFHANVAFNGEVYLVVWEQGDGVHGARVRAADGAILDAIPLTFGDGFPSGHVTRPGPDVASNGQDFYVVWDNARDEEGIHATRIRASDGAVLDDSLVLGGGRAGDPAVGFDGVDYVVVWRAWEGEQQVAVSARVDAVTGRSRGPARPLSAPWTGRGGGVDIACQTGACLVAWRQKDLTRREDEVWTTLIRTAPRAPLPLARNLARETSSDGRPLVAAAHGTFLVAWATADTDTYSRPDDIHGRLVDAISGEPAGDELALTTLPLLQTPQALGSDGRSFLLAWSTPSPVGDTARDTHVTRFHVTGQGIDVNPQGTLVRADTGYGFFAGGTASAATGHYLLAYATDHRVMARFLVFNDQVLE